MDEVTGTVIEPAQAPLPEQVLKGRRAWWLYLIPIIAIAALPLAAFGPRRYTRLAGRFA